MLKRMSFTEIERREGKEILISIQPPSRAANPQSIQPDVWTTVVNNVYPAPGL
ncbi:hypothetical protein [Paenibacillus campi]|uniref:hypothetical protein n=1 Tax=Paenibacillus campi TaxID=3106031 RepID=UPI002AFF9B84|nr:MULTISPECIES: hypothetical protein [unclassified Paenibacillus]